jgi:hypothetical protein
MTIFSAISTIVQVLFNDSKDEIQQLFTIACRIGNIDVINVVLELDVIDLFFDDLTTAICKGQFNVVDRLLRLQDKSLDPSANKNEAIRRACHFNSVDIVDRLLQELCVDPSDDHNYAIRTACKNGYDAIVDRLLQDSRVFPQYGFMLACGSGRISIVDRLLQESKNRLDPSYENNEAIRLACNYGLNIDIIDLLLQDPSVDPSAINNYAIRMACKNGHTAVVERLIKDWRVDPSFNINEPLRIAIRCQRHDIASILRKDSRVSSKENATLILKNNV